MSTLPEPYVPAEVDLQGLPHFLFDVRRFRDSNFVAEVDPEAGFYGIVLWAAAWHQRPAASLPDDDAILARLAGLGRDTATWARVKKDALKGWELCNDKRWHHKVLAMKALEQWVRTLSLRDRSGKGNAKQTGGTYDPAPIQAQLARAIHAMEELTRRSGEPHVVQMKLPLAPKAPDKGAPKAPPRDALKGSLKGAPRDPPKDPEEKGREGNSIEGLKPLVLAGEDGWRPTDYYDCGPSFERFYAAYPRKEKKADAAKSWERICKATPATEWPKLVDEIIETVKRRCEEDAQWIRRTADDGRLIIPQPSTFLNGKRWTDTFEKIVIRSSRADKEDNNRNVARSWAERK